MCSWRSGTAALGAPARPSSVRSTPARKSTCSWLPKMESMTVAAAINARLFARLREQAGIDSDTVHVPERSTVRAVYAALRRAHPALESNLDAVRPAINMEFSEWDATVAEGDEVAFIPPVSGGANAVGVMFEVTTQLLAARRAQSAVTHARAGPICTFTG